MSVIDTEVAAALAQNPDVAHFAADLASGTPLELAVKDHFSHLLAPSQPEPEPVAPAANPEPAEPAPAPPAQELYQSEPTSPQPAEPSAADRFLSNPRPSFWA